MRSRTNKTTQPKPQPPPVIELPLEKLAWDIDDAAERISVGKSTIYRLLKEKKLAPTRILGCTRISEEELKRYVRENTSTPAA